MTSLPETRPERRLGLVIDLDTCVGCQACVVALQGMEHRRLSGAAVRPGPLRQRARRLAQPRARLRGGRRGAAGRVVHFPKSCLHCEDAPCVTVCPTGASYKRVEDGIVLVDEDICIGCGLCAWACPYGAREMDAAAA